MRNRASCEISGQTSSRPPASLETILPRRRDSFADTQHRVLLLDEAKESHSMLEELAPALGALVHHARTIEDALRFAARFSYETLVIDCERDRDARLAALSELSELQPNAALLSSGYGACLTAPAELSVNWVGSLKKPWEAPELEAALRRCLDFCRARQRARGRATAASYQFERLLCIGGVAHAERLEALFGEVLAEGSVLHVESLEEGLGAASRGAFDAVLTELALPDACGLDAVLRIRRAAPQLPLLVLLAEDDGVWADQVLLAGAQDALVAAELDGGRLLCALRHAEQRQRAQARLEHGALHDELTSLARRALLQQRIANALARSRRIGNTFAVVYMDLDHFKSINDTYGHEVGDEVLIAVSQRLSAAVREYDTVARLGGDEFAILLDSLDDPREAETVAQRMLASLRLPVRVAGRELDVTASMGISVFPDGGMAADALLRSADQAMYCAKRRGRNTYSQTPSVAAEARAPSSTLRATGVRLSESAPPSGTGARASY